MRPGHDTSVGSAGFDQAGAQSGQAVAARNGADPCSDRTQSDTTVVAALSGTTSLLLLGVFTIVNICCLVLRRDPTAEGGFRAPTVMSVFVH